MASIRRSSSVLGTPPQKPAPATKPAAAIKPAATTKPAGKSSLGDSKFATPTSSTPAASSAKAPRTPTRARRTVPREKTAGFSTRAKAARPKPIDEPDSSDEQQEEKTSETLAAVLLDIDLDAEERGEAQVQQLLHSPGVADLTGITFPKGGNIVPLSTESAVSSAFKAWLETPEFRGSNFPDLDLLISH